MERDVGEGGLGGPLDFLVLADKGSHVATLYGTRQTEADTVKATFILDKYRLVRYRAYTANHLEQSVGELLRRVVAVQGLDQQQQQGQQRLLAPAGWLPGGQLISCKPQDKRSFCKQLAKAEKIRSGSGSSTATTSKAAADSSNGQAKSENKACSKATNGTTSSTEGKGSLSQKLPASSALTGKTQTVGGQPILTSGTTTPAVPAAKVTPTSPTPAKGKTAATGIGGQKKLPVADKKSKKK